MERSFVNRGADRRAGAMPRAGERRCGRERRRSDCSARLKLFENLPPATIGELLPGCPVRQFRRETVVLVPGQANEHVYLLLSGRLRVHLDAIEADHCIRLEAGDCIGELSLIDGKPVSAFVVAEPGTSLLIVGQQHFYSRLLPHPAVARNLLRLLTERMRRNNEAIVEGFKQQLLLEHIQRELNLAREIQASMLPRGLPARPGAATVEVFAAMEPARQVGGDLYDYFLTADGKLCFVVGDVSDKGMPAALFMARTVDIVRVVSRLLRGADGAACDAGEILACVNHDLCQNNASHMFVTMFLGVLDPASGELRYCNAGHNPPYLIGDAGAARVVDGARGLPIGIRAEGAYRTHVTRLGPGQSLFVFIDGITEATAEDGSFFGEQRLVALLGASRAASARALVDEVLAEVKAFVGGAPQADDITTLALRLSPPAR